MFDEWFQPIMLCHISYVALYVWHVPLGLGIRVVDALQLWCVTLRIKVTLSVIKNIPQTAVINIAFQRILIHNLTFRMLV